MTREEAFERLKDGAPFSELLDAKWEDAINMAIEALKQEPCKDAVSRQELMKEFAELPHEYKNAEERGRTNGISACQVIVLKAKPVAPTRPKGRWIGYVRSNGTVYHCEKCGRKTVVKENFCPSCGYDMREGE